MIRDVSAYVKGGPSRTNGSNEQGLATGITNVKSTREGFWEAVCQGFLQKLDEIYASCSIGPDIAALGVLSRRVQFLPAYSALVQEAVADAKELEYEGVKVRVIDPEHLVALALQAGGARRRERAWQLFEAGQIDRHRLRALFARHGISAELPDDV